ncbi:MAG: hypothetical protein QOH09_3305 [Pseudonocardiales bacterium]|jgi:uncharacterized membrane protein|nr:integral rane protein-like protein [Pseudonocardiales bacterium]MDT7717313.1 hypothetical protein [Pseudonocardiales bacterium]
MTTPTQEISTTSPGLFALTLVAALSCGTVAGVFFGFSAFVMDGLGRLPAPQGIAAMQSINISAVRPAFMTALFGAAAACLALVVWSLLAWGQRGSALLLVGAALYLVGTIGLTIVYHVPLNDALATVDPNSAAAAGRWAGYLADWTRWNHVRTAAALAAAAAFTVVLAWS